jgi:cysteine desulfurase/selenocysteine lyase
MEKIHAYEQELVEQLYTGMVNLPGVTVFGPRQRAGLVSFTLEGVHPHDVSTLFDQEGIAIRAGHHCTQPLHRHLGIQSSARASVYFYNTPAEVEQFLETLAAAVAFFQSL